MRITYSPDDDAPRTWAYQADKVKASVAEIIEKRYGESWDQFNAGVLLGTAKARRVLLWYLLWLEHHTLRYEDTPDFAMGELKVEMTHAELLAYREQIEKSSDPKKDKLLASLADEIAAAAEWENEHGGDAEGKAL